MEQPVADQLGVATSAIVPDDETKLQCPSGPHELAGRGFHKWGNAEWDFGPYDDEATAVQEAKKGCKTKTDEAVKATEDAAKSACKEDIARVGCALGPDDKACDPKSTQVQACEVTDRWNTVGETRAPRKIGEQYYVKCLYNPSARARGKTTFSCELRR